MLMVDMVSMFEYVMSFPSKLTKEVFFQGGESEDIPTVISRVALNTPAHRALLREGDIILAINNIDIRNHPHEEIVNMIRTSHELELTIKYSEKKNSLNESLEAMRQSLSSNQFEVN
jgi:C-terminal processing protease CtpA/Prc